MSEAAKSSGTELATVEIAAALVSNKVGARTVNSTKMAVAAAAGTKMFSRCQIRSVRKQKSDC